MKRYCLLYIAVSACFCLCFASCEKYLEKKSDSGLIVPATLNDFQGILDDNGLMNTKTPSFGESSSDDYFILDDVYNSEGVFNRHFYTWVRDEYKFQNDWSFGYVPIYNSNLCLEGIEKIQLTNVNELQWKNIKGSALFYRAYYFLNLTWIFAKAYDETTFNQDLGIVLRLGSDFNKPSVRASVKECYEKIVADAKEAALYLPDNPLHPMRPSKAAAYGLLARAYLSMRNYDSAFKYASQTLSIKNTLLDYNSIPISSSVPFPPFNPEIIFYTEMNETITLHSPILGNIDTTLYSSYETNDLRKTAFFELSNGFPLFKGSYSADNYIFFTGIATDEMYLIRAECYARAGKTSDAMNDLNTLLEKRWQVGLFTPKVATDSSDAINWIMLERRKELLMRGLRWMDLKRLNKENANITLKRVISGESYTLPPNDNRYAIPLPKDIIDLTGMPQNLQ